MNGKKNMRRISALVTAQTAYNLDKLAAMCGYRERGHVIDKLVPCNRVPPWVPLLLRQTNRPPL